MNYIDQWPDDDNTPSLPKTSRFDLEQQIMHCWSVCEDLETLYQGVLDTDLDRDTIANILLGMQQLYNIKFNKLFDTFEACIKTKEV